MTFTTKCTKVTKNRSKWIHLLLCGFSVLRGRIFVIKPLWVALFISTSFFAGRCLSQEGKDSWISTTEGFLSELKLMQGDKESFTPDTYYAPGGIICLVIEGDIKYYRPFGYSKAYDIESLTDKPAIHFDPSLGTPVKENSLFRLGSTSKMFVGLSLAICKDRGLVSYDDPISKYLNEFLYTEAGDTSLTQLFTHSGGFPPLHKLGLQERDNEVTSATITEIVSDALELTPDPSKVNQFSYSNIGVLLLAEVVSRVLTQSYESFVQNEILNPLGMKNTYFHTSQVNQSLRTTGYFPNFRPATDPDLQGYAPVGGMYSTGPDMAKLMSLFQIALNWKGESLPIKPKIIQDLTSIYLAEEQHAMGISIDIGSRNGQTMIGHNGRIDGYASYFAFAKEAEIGLIFMANGGFPLGRTSAPELLNRLIQTSTPKATKQ